MLHLSEFVWALCSSVLVVFNNFLLIDATDRSKISSDKKRFFIALSLYPLSFFANTPFKYFLFQVRFKSKFAKILLDIYLSIYLSIYLNVYLSILLYKESILVSCIPCLPYLVPSTVRISRKQN